MNSTTNNTILIEKLRESLSSVLPVAGVVFVLCFSIVPVPNSILMAFVVGTIMLIVGMGLFTLGSDRAMMPMGVHIGSATIRTRKLWLILAVALVVGVIITISEPDLQVLAQQVPNIPKYTLIFAVAAGVGLFLLLAVLRIFLQVPLRFLLIGFYVVVFVLAQFVPVDYLSVAFDAGGVTTGPMTVPFIMALGAGIALTRNDRSAEEDSFGLVALASVGPIFAVLLLGLIFQTEGQDYTPLVIPEIADSRELWQLFSAQLPHYLSEVAVALLPIVLFFGLFQVVRLRLNKQELLKLGVGLLYVFLGLTLFLTGANVGFMPVGNYLGQLIGELDYRWVSIPIGMLIGYFIVQAEPAVHVLNKQVEEMTAGAIPKKAMSLSLSSGVAISVGLAMLRILAGLPLMWLLIPGYTLALALSFFVPRIFTAIAFDSGGVASGPMTATFLLPLAMGLCAAVGGNIAVDAFGMVAMVAMTPLITIQILGLVYQIKLKRQQRQAAQTA
ncbi:MAG: DUF1538 domain-containing protein, partial [Bacillota bacterium]|nr:DUF1538 domain-containing protein [Bacillota bacterium]